MNGPWHNAWLALGANIGDPPAQLDAALTALAAQPDIEVLARSSVRVTAPWGKTDQPEFFNMAASIRTRLDPHQLLLACLGVEAEMGRQRLEHWGPRVIDIDVIAYERVILNTPNLTLPHRFAHERDFVLTPLREIAPGTADWLVAREANAEPNLSR